jgi:hypothetical protein
MRFLSAAAAVLAAAGCATSTPAPPASGPETYIPYANRDGIAEWRVAGSDGLYARALTGGWYLIRLVGPCSGLRADMPLLFDTRQGRLDRFSAIEVERERCPVESVTRIAGEPPKSRRGR